jgi:biopolymer transport protein ExbD
MRVPRLGHQRSVEFNVTPMIDVVFLLIIFFLVSSHLARQETQLALELPDAASGLPQPVEAPPRVTINVLGDGALHLGGDPASVIEIGQRLLVEKQRQPQDLEVRIRGARTVAFGDVRPVLAACIEAGVWNVTFAVTERPGGP